MNRNITIIRSGLIWAALPATLFVLLCNCHTKPIVDNTHVYTQLPDSDYFIKNQVVVWKNPKSTAIDWQTWLNTLRAQRPTMKVLSVCPHCDDSLILIADTGLNLLLQSQTVGGGSGTPPGGPHGDDGPAFLCSNFLVNVLDSSTNYKISAPDTPRFGPDFPVVKGKSVIVAVFDSGLEPSGGSVLATALQTCLVAPTSNGINGFDFTTGTIGTAGTTGTPDDLADHHGTEVARIITTQAQLYGGKVSILPVKLFSASKTADFFHLLCAISYASKAGANIINASFGFYHYPDIAANNWSENLFHKYLARYLGAYNMLLVAAAGNDVPAEDVAFLNITHATNDQLRKLDSNRFYPAYFAHSDSNIITVTTVSRRTAIPSPKQNFSPLTVDVGVDCDAVSANTGDYLFYDALMPYLAVPAGAVPAHFEFATITGSSYAAPVVTGRIAALYGKLNAKTDKKLILQQLLTMSHPSRSSPPLIADTNFNSSIKGGIIAPK